MKQTDEERIKSGVSLEPLTPVEGSTPNGTTSGSGRIKAIIAGLSAGQTEPHLGELLRMVEQGKSDPDTAGLACIVLSKYYQDDYNNLNGNRDLERAIYYSQLAGDYNSRCKGTADQTLITAYVWQGNAAQAAEALLRCARTEEITSEYQAFGFLAWREAWNLLLPTGEPARPWYWGTVYLLLRKQSQATEVVDDFERSEARNQATALLRDVVKHESVLTQNAELKGCFTQQLSIAMEAQPDGEDLKLLQSLKGYYIESPSQKNGTVNHAQRASEKKPKVHEAQTPLTKALGWSAIGVYILYVCITVFIGFLLFDSYFGKRIGHDINAITFVLLETINCFVSSFIPLFLFALLVSLAYPRARKHLFSPLLRRNLALAVVAAVLTILSMFDIIPIDEGLASGFFTLVYVLISPFLMISSAKKWSVAQ